MIELEDEQASPTLDGIESLLARMSQTASELYSKTYDTTRVEVFSIDFTPPTDEQPEADA